MSFMTCCVAGCLVKYGKGVPLHRFPNPDTDKERFESWVKHIGGEIAMLEHNFVFLNRRICHEHFEPIYYQAKNRLFKVAVPSLHLASRAAKQSSQIDAASSDKHTGGENNAPDKSVYSWDTKRELVLIKQDEPEHHDDIPDDFSMYCDDDAPDENNRASWHEGFHCNICNGDIIGYRYTCVQCSGLDLCVTCESSGAHAHHYVLRVPGPRPYNEIHNILSRIRKYLMTEFDPISASDMDNEDAISVKSEVKSEDEEKDAEDNEQVNALTKDAVDPTTTGEHSSLLPTVPQCTENTDCEFILPNNTSDISQGKILHAGFMDEGNNQKSNDSTELILCSTAKRKIISKLSNSIETKGSKQLAKKLCVMPSTSRENIKETITVCCQNAEPEQTKLKYLMLPPSRVYKRSKTNAEKCSDYYYRKKGAKKKNKRSAQTNAERCRAYRLRKKYITQRSHESCVSETLYTPSVMDSSPQPGITGTNLIKTTT